MDVVELVTAEPIAGELAERVEVHRCSVGSFLAVLRSSRRGQRVAAGLTQADLAHRTGYGVSTIWRWERGGVMTDLQEDDWRAAIDAGRVRRGRRG